MRDENCIFCKIANGEIPSRTLYEDNDFRVILDLAPATKGHALILPKNHYKNLYEIEEETAAKVMPLAKKMAVEITQKLGCDGFNLMQNNNEIAGQTVFHFHMHLIPRYNNDNQNLVMKPQQATDEELDAVREAIVGNGK
ncbi:MAG: HIT family protein [Lachnospiraceae bacterium]|jgi:histidine triad (HIT) family protein|nr:HIT family protein [Lachnospiraceae bacterium]